MSKGTPIVERFAPSPTGLLHLGHAYSAITAFQGARGGRFLLRIEDIDFNRSKPAFETQIFDDLHWLGIEWEQPVLRQSDRKPAYEAALKTLWDQNLIYPCECTRRDISIASAPQEGHETLLGPDGVIYPGTCRHKTRPEDYGKSALRLDMHQLNEAEFHFTDLERGQTTFSKQQAIDSIGDVVLARKDIGISYHLAVVLDDAFQGVTHVTRGADLFEATRIHVILQRILGLPTPIYRHHNLIRDDAGKRLAKRDDAKSIKSYREAGYSPSDLRKLMSLGS
ncbi:tRNA glutamyl-Q synthetase [Amylibacter marinus]|uniref:tRNA glutamyl-Q synthetase n=1 Tax=Amylibacter marinus TaxID=1475483 RepID=A0ABQ5VSD1_9RHOB|nr:tRNA glutamyl-Q(34) synthetase GluQRS [Amylibacter marinus]GLQ34276.1 tRNA glutamyl-Q synthetase [Amylibacter marinus]